MSILLLCLTILLTSQNRPVEQEKQYKQKKQDDYSFTVLDTFRVERKIDTIYLEQLTINKRLDSLVQKKMIK